MIVISKQQKILEIPFLQRKNTRNDYQEVLEDLVGQVVREDQVAQESRRQNWTLQEVRVDQDYRANRAFPMGPEGQAVLACLLQEDQPFPVQEVQGAP